MPCVIRRRTGDRWENHVELAPQDWSIGPQVDALHDWLGANLKELDPKFSWAADIGFCPRSGALGGGPVISRQLMERCLKANLEIYLSEYPPEDEQSSRQ
jgi:hypothetical protein